jgi:hypothetical protein
VVGEFSLRQVSADVLEHLERRRPAIVNDEKLVAVEVKHALVPVRKSYAELDMPRAYMDALEEELVESLPARWRNVAVPFTQDEKRSFGVWRGGDLFARLTYSAGGLLVGLFIVWAPFIPIWWKWLPLLVAIAAWWVPDAQTALRRRRYARALGEIVTSYDAAQKQLDRHVTMQDLLPPAGKGDK